MQTENLSRPQAAIVQSRESALVRDTSDGNQRLQFNPTLDRGYSVAATSRSAIRLQARR